MVAVRSISRVPIRQSGRANVSSPPPIQEQLRRQSPNAGSAGLAVNSPHFTGRALDLYVGGDPVDTKDANRAIQVNTPVYKWLVRNAARFGFRPYFYEPWHWEYVGEGASATLPESRSY